MNYAFLYRDSYLINVSHAGSTICAYYAGVFWSGVATVAYLPSTAFPAGCGAQSGLPIGLQLIGPEGGDYLTIHLAGLLEKEAGFKAALPAE